jgi:hypothetical protein
MNVCYYLTSHGLGHSVRACAICERLPHDVHVTFRTAVPKALFDEELRRPFEWSEARFDCGCLQSDSVTVDVGRTARAYARIAVENTKRLRDEAAWLAQRGADIVVCDIPSFPFEAARAAGVPSLAVANFTWCDVYAEYAAEEPVLVGTVEAMREQYAGADMLAEVSPALPMDYFTRRVPVGVIGRRGGDVREALCDSLDIRRGSRLALVYMGTFGMDMAWERLGRFDGWTFLSVDPLPGSSPNTRVFDRKRFRFHDVAASVDLVISKLGYGIYSGCLLNGVPLMYLPRDRFAEYPALEGGIEAWGHGCRLTGEEFRSLAWGRALDTAAMRAGPEPLPDTGAAAAARIIVDTAG